MLISGQCDLFVISFFLKSFVLLRDTETDWTTASMSLGVGLMKYSLLFQFSEISTDGDDGVVHLCGPGQTHLTQSACP